jgi:hypothetical protein
MNIKQLIKEKVINQTSLDLECSMCRFRPSQLTILPIDTPVTTKDATADCMICKSCCDNVENKKEKNLNSSLGIFPYRKVFLHKEDLKHLREVLDLYRQPNNEAPLQSQHPE